MKKTVIFITCIIMILSLAACGKKEEEQENLGNLGQVQMANPFADCNNMEDAAKAAGFSMTVPSKLPDWVNETAIRAAENSMIEVIYTGKNDQEMRIRKAPGLDDISGVYEIYNEEAQITVNGMTVHTRGNDGSIHVVTWSMGTYSYSVSSSVGMTEENMIDLIADIQ